MEDGAEDPRGHAEVGEQLVVATQGVVGRHALTQPGQARLVRDEVAEAEEHREGLLHAEQADERPLPVELRDGFPGCETAARGDVLARVVAFLRARPEEESVVEGYTKRRADVSVESKVYRLKLELELELVRSLARREGEAEGEGRCGDANRDRTYVWELGRCSDRNSHARTPVNW